jgi:hypothetical protein
MADIKLNYVNSYRDPRNGKMRHQFRRKGCRKIMLKGRPGSADFMVPGSRRPARPRAAVIPRGAMFRSPDIASIMPTAPWRGAQWS